MPYPHEHAARFHEPKLFKRFRRENDKLGDGVDVIFGVKADGGTEIQALRFKSDRWTYKQAAEWLHQHRKETGKPISFEQARGGEEEAPGAPAEEKDALEADPKAQASPAELHDGWTKIVRWLNTPWAEE